MDSPPALPGLKLLAKLGQGGMGTVWKAQDLGLQRTVAVKLLSGELAVDPDFVARFQREARYLARVKHPNLVTIYDVVTAGAIPYLVMEYVEGSTLARRLAKGAMPWGEAEPLLKELLEAVSAIHAAGLVHRDLKPANILLDASGRVKVMDFGLAKDASAAALTQEGMLLGTPEYMSPEQARGAAVSPASDVYALGIIAYQMLSGKPPFKGAGTGATLRMQCQDDPAPLAAQGLPPSEAAWILRALAKEPEARFKDASEMRRALGARIPAPSPAAPLPAAPPPSRPAWMRWAAGLAGAVLALAVLKGLRDRGQRPPTWAALTLAGQSALRGELVSIRPLPEGGHVVALKVDGEERAIEIPAGQSADLTLEPSGGR